MGLEQEVTKAIEVAGNKGRYQFIIVALLSLIFYFDAFALQGATFYFMDPTFICDGSDEIVDELEACDKLAECHISKYAQMQPMILPLRSSWVCIAIGKVSEMRSRPYSRSAHWSGLSS